MQKLGKSDENLTLLWLDQLDWFQSLWIVLLLIVNRAPNVTQGCRKQDKIRLNRFLRDGHTDEGACEVFEH